MPFPNILLSPAAPPILHWVLGVVPSCMPSQNPPLYAEAYIHSRIVPSLVSPPAAIQCIAAAPRRVSSSVVPPALLHCSGSAVPFLPYIRTLPAASSLHSPSFRPFPLRAILLFPQALLLYPCNERLLFSSSIPASPASSAWSSASAGTHAASPSTVDL